MNTHKDHRKRMREKYEQDGADSFETHRLLEMLLYSFISRADTNPTAHRVLDAFHDEKLFSADAKALTAVPGMGSASANGLVLSCQTAKRLLCDNLEKSGLDSDFKLQMYLYLRVFDKPYESSFVLYLKPNNKIAGWKELQNYNGDVKLLCAEITDGARDMTKLRAAVCHSHGTNPSTPSVEDVYITKYLMKNLCGPGVTFAGNYVVSTTDCTLCTVPAEVGGENTDNMSNTDNEE